MHTHCDNLKSIRFGNFWLLRTLHGKICKYFRYLNVLMIHTTCKQGCSNVDATLWPRIDFDTTLFKHPIPHFTTLVISVCICFSLLPVMLLSSILWLKNEKKKKMLSRLCDISIIFVIWIMLIVSKPVRLSHNTMPSIRQYLTPESYHLTHAWTYKGTALWLNVLDIHFGHYKF